MGFFTLPPTGGGKKRVPTEIVVTRAYTGEKRREVEGGIIMYISYPTTVRPSKENPPMSHRYKTARG